MSVVVFHRSLFYLLLHLVKIGQHGSHVTQEIQRGEQSFCAEGLKNSEMGVEGASSLLFCPTWCEHMDKQNPRAAPPGCPRTSRQLGCGRRMRVSWGWYLSSSAALPRPPREDAVRVTGSQLGATTCGDVWRHCPNTGDVPDCGCGQGLQRMGTSGCLPVGCCKAFLMFLS